METKWNCPHCEFENTDQDDTVFPLCGGCGEPVSWSEIEDSQQAENKSDDDPTDHIPSGDYWMNGNLVGL